MPQKPRLLFSRISVRPYWRRDLTITFVSKIMTPQCVILNKHVSFFRIAVDSRSTGYVARRQVSGIGATRTLTKPRSLILATSRCSLSTRLPTSLVVVSKKRCRSLSRFWISYRTMLDAFALKASIAQAQGDLPLASTLLASLRPAADDSGAVETQVYQAILERRPADQSSPRLKEILTKPDPTLSYLNGELRFWLGWAQEVAGDHGAAREVGTRRAANLKLFLKNNRKTIFSL